jgi:biopolymer transport protein ExbD
MKLVKASAGGGKVGFDMTPMIDVCFQLIIFFMVSLRLFSPEGDFNIKMPLAAPTPGPPSDTQLPPIKIRLTAQADGCLAGLKMAERDLGGLPHREQFGKTPEEQAKYEQLKRALFRALHAQIRGIVRDAGGPGSVADTEVELDCDYNLKFDYVIEAITAVSGYVEQGRIIRLIEKVKFSPPRPR